ncbi:MAG: AIR synthase family protein [Christensenellaceae bacterium]|jgi:hydrogenase expression/formation protein HypE
MKQGKFTNTELENLIFKRLTLQNPDTIVGAGVGEDCCAIRFGEDICVVSTDPITAASSQAGVLAMHINANDIASAGAIPIAALTTVLIPVDAKLETVETVVRQLADTAKQLNIDITGGHTEVTESVNRIVVSVTMMGRPVIPGRIFRTADMQVGDDIIMTKYAGMEGTSILADDYATELRDILDEQDFVELNMVRDGLSVLPDGLAAAKTEGVHAMHDITEGGILGAVTEMCAAAGLGAVIDLSKVPVLPVTEKICTYYGLDVYGLISSGSMLIAAENGTEAIVELKKAGISSVIVGKATLPESGVVDENGKLLTVYESDELYKVVGRQ